MRLVLVGGGHAHLIVLEALAERRDATLDVTLVTPSRWQYYSGMLPGWIMGRYGEDDCRVDLRPLASRAGANLVLGRVVAMNADRSLLCLQDGRHLEYDMLSLNTGSETNVEWLASLSERLLTVKPVEQFFALWQEVVNPLAARPCPSIVVVGGGAAGAELSIAVKSALSAADGKCSVTLVAGNSGLLSGHNPMVRRRMQSALDAAGIRVLRERAAGVEDGVLLPGGELVKADLVIAATGARPSAFLAQSRLALSDDGFVAVDNFHRSPSHPNVFAAGDVSTRLDGATTRSGVHAVRAGPILAHNLIAATKGLPLGPYKPRKRSLYLIVSGPDKAIVSWGGLGVAGRRAWRWKDRIDRNFIKRFHRGERDRVSRMQEFFAVALQRSIVANALRIALFVGTVLNLINQGGAVLSGDAPSWLHVVLNYVVPYCVATYSAVRNEMRHEHVAINPAPRNGSDISHLPSPRGHLPGSASPQLPASIAAEESAQEAPSQAAGGRNLTPPDSQHRQQVRPTDPGDDLRAS